MPRVRKTEPNPEVPMLTIIPVTSVTHFDFSFDLTEVAKEAGYPGPAVISGAAPVPPETINAVADRREHLAQAIGRSAGRSIDSRRFPRPVADRLKEAVRQSLTEAKIPIEE